MITATDLELRAGPRILLEPTTLRVQPGDRIGLVGRNGAGKTTSLRVMAGESLPHAGSVARTGPVGYLPQDPRTGDLTVTARDRVLSARGLDQLVTDITKIQVQLAERPDDDALVRRYGQLEERFTALGGYVAEDDSLHGDERSRSDAAPDGDLPARGRHRCSRRGARHVAQRQSSDRVLTR